MIAAAALARRLWKVLARVFPQCSMIAQAIAFNLFLAFFPTLLIAVGFATSRIGGKTELLSLITDLTRFLPPGTHQLVGDFLMQRGPGAWKVVLVGWTGTLFAGTQVMKLFMEGIHLIYGDEDRAGFLHRQLRGLLLLLITFAPLLVAAVLGVLGRPLRQWLAHEIGAHGHVHALWGALFPAISFVLAMLSLTVIYRVARPKPESLRNVLPGAFVATLLWWGVNALFGLYVRKFPYGLLYRGVAATIGLLIWMQLSAIIVFVGAAWNAVAAAERCQQP